MAVLGFAQGTRRPKGGEDVGERDRPGERERYFRKGRTLKGESSAALRYRAYKEKLSRRAARAAAAAPGSSRTLSSTPSAPALPSPAGPQWMPLGPAPIGVDATSGQDYGVNTGRVTSVVVDQADPTGNTVYVGAAYGGLWRSTNAANPDPANVQWTPLIDDQPTLAVGAIALKPDDSNTILVGTGEANNSGDSYYGLGILRSTDGGATWDLITATSDNTKSFKGLAFSKIAFSRDNPNVVVAGTANSNAQGIDTSNIRGIYYSTDAGINWQYATLQDNGVTVWPASTSSVIYHPTLHKFFAAVRFHGYYSSSDGANWTRLAVQPGGSVLSTTACPGNATIVSCPIYRGELAIQPVTGDLYTWYVDGGNRDRGIFKSSNGGASWVAVGIGGIDSCGDAGGGCGTLDQGDYDLTIAAVPNGAGTDLYAGAINIYKCSLAAGVSSCALWLNLTHVYGCTVWGQTANVHPDQHGIDFPRANPRLLYFGHDGGVSRALNGSGLFGGACTSHNAFDNLSGTLGSLTEFISFSQHPSDPSTLLGGAQDVGTSAVDSSHPGLGTLAWMNVNAGDGGFNAINPTNPIEWFSAYTDVSIQRCTHGINCNYQDFLPVITNSKVGSDHGDFYTPYILDPGMPSKIIVGTCRVWRGNSDGTGWSSANVLSYNFDRFNTTSCTGAESKLVSALAAGGPTGPGGSQAIYAGTDDGTIFSTTNASGGLGTWSYWDLGYRVSDIVIDPRDETGNTAYATTMGFNGIGCCTSHIWKTTNGFGWVPIGGDLPDVPVNSIALDPNLPDVIYVGTDIGVFATYNGGANWTEWGAGLPNAPVTRIRTFVSQDKSKNRLRVSTYGRGVWETDLVSAPTNQFDLTLGPVTPSVITVQRGSSDSTATLQVAVSDNFFDVVDLSCDPASLPAAVSCSFSPAPPLTFSAQKLVTVALTVSAFDAAVPGTYTVTLLATSRLVGPKTQSFTLTISPKPEFKLTLSPNPITAKPGQTVSAVYSIDAIDGYTGTIELACYTSVSCTVTPSTATAFPASGTLELTVPPGVGSSFGVTLRASDGTLQRDLWFSLNVMQFLVWGPGSIVAVPGSTINTTAQINPYSFDGPVVATCDASALDPAATCVVNGSPFTLAHSGPLIAVPLTVTVPQSVTQASAPVTLHVYDPTYPALSRDATFQVDVPFSWTTNSSQFQQVLPGQATDNYFATFTGGLGLSSPATFACTGLPAGATCVFTPPSIASPVGPTLVSVKVATTAAVAIADYPFAITATAAGVTKSVNATLRVGDFGVSNSPSVWYLAPGIGQFVFVRTTSTNNYSGMLSIACPEILPAGLTCYGGGNLSAGGSGVLHFDVQPTVAPQTFNLIVAVTSTAGGVTVTRYGNFSVVIQDFSLSLTPATQTASPAGPITLTATVTGFNGFDLPVQLTCSSTDFWGRLPGVDCSASPQTVYPGQSATVTVIASDVSDGLDATNQRRLQAAIPLQITASSSFERTASATINLADFAILPPTTFWASLAGATVPLSWTVTARNGFNAPVSLSCDTGGAPGVSCSVSPQVVTPATTGTTVTVTLTTPSSPPDASYNLTLQGTGAGITHKTVIDWGVGGFRMSLTPDNYQLPAGGGSALVTANAFNDSMWNTLVTWSCPSAPPGVACSFSPASVSLASGQSGSSNVAINVSSSVPAGGIPLVVRGSAGATVQTGTVQLVVGSDFQLLTLTPTAEFVKGQSQAYTVSVASSNGYSQPVTLACSGLPQGVGCAFDINPVTPTQAGRAVRITVSTTDATPSGVSGFSIIGTSGTIIHVSLPAPQIMVPDFLLDVRPPIGGVTAGKAFVAVYGSAVGGLPTNTIVDFSCTPADPTVTCEIHGGAGLAGQPVANMVVTASPETPPSDIVVLVHAVQRGGSLSHDLPFTLRISDLSLSQPAPQSVPQAGKATYTFTATGLNHYPGASFSCKNLPAGVGPCIFTPPGVDFYHGPSSATVVLTLPVDGSAQPGQSIFQITGGYSSAERSVDASLTVLPLQDFALAPLGSSYQPALAGQTLTWPLQLTPLNDFSGNVTLSLSGCPNGAVCSFTPNTAIALGNRTPQTASVSMQVPVTAGVGNLSVTVSATDAASGKTHSHTVTASVGTFSITVTPTTVSATPGYPLYLQVNVTGQNVVTPVTLGCAGLASGMTCTSSQVVIGQPGALTAYTTPGVTPANGTFNVSGSAFGITKTAPVTFKLVDFTLTSTTTTGTVIAGNAATVSLVSAALNGWNGGVAMLDCPPVAVGISCSYYPGALTPSVTGTTVTATIRTAANTPAGVYVVPLRAQAGSLTHTVNFTLTVKNFHATVQPDTAITPVGGGKATYALTFFADQGFNSLLSLSCLTPPTGVTCAFSPASVTPTVAGAPVTLTVTVASTVAQGSKTLNIRAVAGTLTQTIPVTLLTGADFALSTVTGPQTVQQGQNVDFHVTATAIGGMNQPVTLSCTGLPAGAGCQFSQNPVMPLAGGQDVDVTVTTTLASVPNSYTVTVQGVAGGITHTTPLALNLQFFPDFVLSSATPLAATRPGQNAVFSATAARNGSFSSIVDLGCAGVLPAGATCQVQPPSADFSSATSVPLTVTVVTAGNTPLGDTQFALHGAERGGVKTHDVPLTLRVNDFHLSAPTPQTFAQTDLAHYDVTVFADNQFSSPVTLSCANLPANVGPCNFSTNNSVPSAAGTMVTVTAPVGPAAAVGQTSFDVVATGGNTSHSVTEPLNILLVQDFVLSTPAPLTQVTTPGQVIGWGMQLTPLNAFAANLNLTISGCPAGYVCSLQPPSPVAVSNQTTQVVSLIVQVPATAAAVNSNITVTALDPVSGKTHALTFTVSVQSFTLTVSPTLRTVAPGAGAVYNVTLTGLNGFNQQVLVACNNPPAGVTCSAAVATPGTTTPITVMTAAGTTVGTKSIQIGGALGLGAPPNVGVKTVTLSVSSILPTFTLTTTAATRTAPIGAAATYTLSVRATTTTFVSPVTMGCLPNSNVTCSFNPVSFTPSTITRTVTLTLTPNPQLNPGSYPFTVQATGGNQVRQLAMTVNVADFWIMVSPGSQLIPNPNGGTASYSVSAQTSSGFNTPVTLSCPGNPAGVTCSFAPASVTPSAAGTASTLTVTTTAASPKGLLNLTVQAASGSLVRQRPLQLTNGQDFALSLMPAVLPQQPGGYSTLINLNAIGPFSDNITLACVGSSPPGGPICGFPGPQGGQGIPGSSVPLDMDIRGVAGGVYTITIQGMGGGLTHTVPLTVNVPDYSLGIVQDLTVADVVVGGAAVFHGTLTAIAGYAGNVNLSCTAPPPLSCGFFPTAPIAPLPAGAPFTFSINVPNGTAPGTYQFQVNADDGNGHLHHSNPSFVVEDFSVSLNSGSATIEAGTSTIVTGTATGINGFTGNVQLSCPPDPNISCVFTPAVVAASATGTPFSVTISATPATPPSTYSVGVRNIAARVIRDLSFALTVTPTNDFNVAVPQPSQAVNAGGSLAFALQVTAVNAFNATVSMTCSSAPAGLTCTPPAAFPVPPGGNFNVQVQTALGIVPGVYNLTLSSSGGGKTHNQTLTVTVRDFAIALTPASQRVLPGAEADYALSMTSGSGFSDSASLTCAIVGSPAGAACAFDQADLAAGGSTTLRITSSSATPPGNYTVNVTATSGVTVHSAAVTVQIGGPDFSLSPSTVSATIAKGGTLNVVLTLKALQGFNSAVSFMCTGSNGNVTCLGSSPVSATPSVAGTTVTVSFKASSSALSGTNLFTFKASGGGQTHSVPISLTVP